MELSLEDPLEDEDVVLLYEPLDAFEVVVGLAFEVVSVTITGLTFELVV